MIDFLAYCQCTRRPFSRESEPSWLLDQAKMLRTQQTSVRVQVDGAVCAVAVDKTDTAADLMARLELATGRPAAEQDLRAIGGGWYGLVDYQQLVSEIPSRAEWALFRDAAAANLGSHLDQIQLVLAGQQQQQHRRVGWQEALAGPCRVRHPVEGFSFRLSADVDLASLEMGRNVEARSSRRGCCLLAGASWTLDPEARVVSVRFARPVSEPLAIVFNSPWRGQAGWRKYRSQVDERPTSIVRSLRLGVALAFEA